MQAPHDEPVVQGALGVAQDVGRTAQQQRVRAGGRGNDLDGDGAPVLGELVQVPQLLAHRLRAADRPGQDRLLDERPQAHRVVAVQSVLLTLVQELQPPLDLVFAGPGVTWGQQGPGIGGCLEQFGHDAGAYVLIKDASNSRWISPTSCAGRMSRSGCHHSCRSGLCVWPARYRPRGCRTGAAGDTVEVSGRAFCQMPVVGPIPVTDCDAECRGGASVPKRVSRR